MLPAIVGHRGARGEAPENTLPSFAQAVLAGVPEIELDVRLSSDDELFVLHDPDLRRTTGHSGAAYRKTLHELLTFDARHAMADWPTPCPIPSLQQVIDQCPESLRFQFEVKTDGKAPLKRTAIRLAAMIREQRLEQRVVVTSSDRQFLKLMRNTAPEIARGYVCQYRHRKPIQTCRELECRWLISHYGLVTGNLMRLAAKHDLRVSVWTVNDLAEAHRLVSLGVDSIITDFPTAFLAHFRSSFSQAPPLS